MLVLLSKTLDLALSPLSWALLLLLGALLVRRRAALRSGLLALALAVLYAFSTSAVASRLARAAGSAAHTTVRPGVTYDAVVVLSGMVDDTTSHASGRPELNAAADRIIAGFEILRQGGARVLLITGGPVHPKPGIASEPELLAEMLRRWGADPSRIVIEKLSRNTHENAVESARIVSARGWRTLLLVTSAAHMPRALACFRKEGLSPDTLPVDRRDGLDDELAWLPRARHLETSEAVLRELAGRVAYRLLGYT